MNFRTAEAELAALSAARGSIEWIVEADADMGQIFADTLDAYRDQIEDLRAELAGDLPPERVTFHLLDGQPWAYSDLRPGKG